MSPKQYITIGIVEIIFGLFLISLLFISAVRIDTLIYGVFVASLGLFSLLYGIYCGLLKKTTLKYNKFILAYSLAVFVTVFSVLFSAGEFYRLINLPSAEGLNNLAKDTDAICIGPGVALILRGVACQHSEFTRESKDLSLVHDIEAKLITSPDLDVYVYKYVGRANTVAMLAYKERYLGNIHLDESLFSFRNNLIENDNYLGLVIASEKSLRILVLEKTTNLVYWADTAKFQNEFKGHELLSVEFEQDSSRLKASIFSYETEKFPTKHTFELSPMATNLEKLLK